MSLEVLWGIRVGLLLHEEKLREVEWLAQDSTVWAGSRSCLQTSTLSGLTLALDGAGQRFCEGQGSFQIVPGRQNRIGTQGLTCVDGNKGVIKIIFILFSRRLRRPTPVSEIGVKSHENSWMSAEEEKWRFCWNVQVAFLHFNLFPERLAKNKQTKNPNPLLILHPCNKSNDC